MNETNTDMNSYPSVNPNSQSVLSSPPPPEHASSKKFELDFFKITIILAIFIVGVSVLVYYTTPTKYKNSRIGVFVQIIGVASIIFVGINLLLSTQDNIYNRGFNQYNIVSQQRIASRQASDSTSEKDSEIIPEYSSLMYPHNRDIQKACSPSSGHNPNDPFDSLNTSSTNHLPCKQAFLRRNYVMSMGDYVANFLQSLKYGNLSSDYVGLSTMCQYLYSDVTYDYFLANLAHNYSPNVVNLVKLIHSHAGKLTYPPTPETFRECALRIRATPEYSTIIENAMK